METRLTDLLGVEHPVMLAGMGGVSYSALVTAVSEAGGFGCLGASTMSDAADGGRDRRRAGGHGQALRRRPADRHARAAWWPRSSRSSRAGPRCSWPGWASRRGRRPVPRPRRPGGQHVRQGRPRPAGPRRRVRHGRRPGHRGRRPHRPGRHDALVPQIVDAVGDAHPGGGRRRHRRRPGAGRGPGPRGPTGCGWAPGSSPRPRPAASPATRTRLPAPPERTAPPSAGPSRARPCGCCATSTRSYFEDHPDELSRSRPSWPGPWQDGAWHLGGGRRTPGRRPGPRGLPHRQGVGAIDALEPAANWCAASWPRPSR